MIARSGNGRRGGLAVAILPWAAVFAVVALILGAYARYAAAALHCEFGLDYSEGLIWQQALWIPGPHMYGDIFHYPFVVFEYPPLFLLLVRLAGMAGGDMLVAGRSISVLATLTACVLLGLTVWRAGRLPGGGRPVLAGAVAGLLPLSLLPILSWSVLMRVDMLALAFTWAGILLGVAAFRRPALLYGAVMAFVAAVFTKQIYVSAPLCMGLVWLVRSPALTCRAYGAGGVVGLAAVGGLSWLTHGGFVRHIFLYTADHVDAARALRQTIVWLQAYPIDFGLVILSVAVLLRWLIVQQRVRSPSSLASAIRRNDQAAAAGFLIPYLLVTTCTLVAAGKTGASRNYFIEWMAGWCALIGVLVGGYAAAQPCYRPGLMRILLPLSLLLQLCPLPAAITRLTREQFSPAHAEAAAALLARSRLVRGPILSDDMVMVVQSGREVGLDPCVLMVLARTGVWGEGRLVDMLRKQAFAAVVTAYGPGDPTFDDRYLPATQTAMLNSYPRIERFGDYRMRLPK